MSALRPHITEVNTPGPVSRDVLETVAGAQGRQRVIVKVQGRAVAAVIALEDLERLKAFEEALEDRLDAEEADAILDAEETGPSGSRGGPVFARDSADARPASRVAWAELKRRLGL